MIQTSQILPTSHTLKAIPSLIKLGEASVTDVTLQSLFDSEETRLLKYAFSFVGRRAVAEEIVQEVFLQLHGRWEDVEFPRAWLYRSVRNRALNHLRDTKKEILNQDGGNQNGGNQNGGNQNGGTCDRLNPADTAEDCPETAQQHLETVAALRNSLDDLSDSDRQLIKLKYFDDLKYREISEESGLKIGYVGYRLHHILKELAAKLRGLGFDEEL